MSGIYEFSSGWTLMMAKDGERAPLANFIAEITDETHFSDGEKEIETVLTITGHQIKRDDNMEETRIELPKVIVSTDNFPSMTWVMQSWGVSAVIWPGSGVRDNLRAAIQQNSHPKVLTVYRHTGWTKLQDGRTAYLHAGGAITSRGNDSSTEILLPPEMRLFDLCTDSKGPESIKATLRLLRVCNPFVSWSLLSGTIAPLFGPVDFGIHLSGRTGTFKSETISLWQSHYGSGMDARHLPASWASTANALEAQAYIAKNAVLAIDDFVPHGTSWMQRAYQATAEKVIRSAGNLSGRARLTDVSSLQRTFFPRGIIFSTGEDAPEGHSVRARLWLLDTAPGDTDPKKLTLSQADRSLFPGTIVSITQHLAGHPNEIKDYQSDSLSIRDANLELGHTRTPSAFGTLLAAARWFLAFSRNIGALPEKAAEKLAAEAADALATVAQRQTQYLESADPCDVFCQTIRQVLGSHSGHIRSMQGGIPRSPEVLGWTLKSDDGGIRSYMSHGPTIGWINWDKAELYIDSNLGMAVIKKTAGPEIAVSKQTLQKRLKDAGMLVRVDDQRQRNTIRVTADNHSRQVIALRTADVFETEEVPE